MVSGKPVKIMLFTLPNLKVEAMAHGKKNYI